MATDRTRAVLFGIVLYPSVEPIDLGATYGVLSMARRVLPGVRAVTLAAQPGAVELAGGVRVSVDHTLDDAPPLDVVIVAGGAGWPEAAADPAMLRFLRRRPAPIMASVCTGAMLLQAAGLLEDRPATTRRMALGDETQAPLTRLAHGCQATLVDTGEVVTGGGVMLAADTTLHLLARHYGEAAAEEVAVAIEYDRARASNRFGLGIVTPTGQEHAA
jgi:transcriptional regulator GlxA family with amidase domain